MTSRTGPCEWIKIRSTASPHDVLLIRPRKTRAVSPLPACCVHPCRARECVSPARPSADSFDMVKIGRRTPALVFGMGLFTFLVLLATLEKVPGRIRPGRCHLNSTRAAWDVALASLRRCNLSTVSPPYLLVTFGNTYPPVLPSVVLKFSATDGCLVSDDALERDEASTGTLGALRGIALEKNAVDPHLMVVSRAANASRLLLYSPCVGVNDAPSFKRRFVKNFTEYGAHNRGLVNPQSIAFGPDSNVYVSEDAFGAVLRYHGLEASGDKMGKPFPSPVFNNASVVPGLFFDVNRGGDTGLRPLTASRGVLWVGVETAFKTWGVDVITGRTLQTVSAAAVGKNKYANTFSPAGLVYESATNILYAANANWTEPPAFAFHMRNSDVARLAGEFQSKKVTWPAGMAVLSEKLYVLSQHDYKIHVFSTATLAYFGNITDALPACPLDIVISNC